MFLVDRLRSLPIPKTLQVELTMRAVMSATAAWPAPGLILVNPPWMLDQELNQLLPPLRDRLAQGPEARSRVEWLREE